MVVKLDPFEFHGSLAASIGAHACGFGFQLSANCAVDCPAFHIYAACDLDISLMVKTLHYHVDVELP